MHMLWLFLTGAVVGCGLTLLTIFTEYKVMSKQQWTSRCLEKVALDASLDEAVAVNARLWVALAASKAAVTAEASVQTQGHELDFASEASTPNDYCTSPITFTTRT
jgi:hypothetical protein